MEILGIISFFIIAIMLYKREDKINGALATRPKLCKLYVLGILFLVSFLFALKLNLSPFNEKMTDVDSSVFLYIGKGMHSGLVPYKDMFDHKGPILYFIEYIGLAIGFGNVLGVWFFEIINIFATAIIFYYIARLFTDSRIVRFLIVFVVLKVCAIRFFEGGNLVEEYALPWISLSLYYVFKFFKTKSYKNIHIVLIGVSFTVVFFLRVNMAGAWLPLVVAVIIWFVKNNRTKEIPKCIGLFCAGCAIAFAPILIYLLATGAFGYMVEYYFVFNFAYTGSEAGIKGMFIFAIDCINILVFSVLFIVYACITNAKNKYLQLNILTLIVAFLSIAVSGRSYAHYGIILIPFFVLPVLLTVDPLMKHLKEATVTIEKKGAMIAVLIVLCLGVLFAPVYSFYDSLKEPANYGSIVKYITENTSEDSDVLVIGNAVKINNYSGRRTSNKFFYQFPPMNVSDKLCDEFLEQLKNNPPDYIIDLAENENYYKGDNYQRITEYLNNACVAGVYKSEERKGYTVYIKVG